MLAKLVDEEGVTDIVSVVALIVALWSVLFGPSTKELNDLEKRIARLEKSGEESVRDTPIKTRTEVESIEAQVRAGATVIR
jgi:hypothetical protein